MTATRSQEARKPRNEEKQQDGEISAQEMDELREKIRNDLRKEMREEIKAEMRAEFKILKMELLTEERPMKSLEESAYGELKGEALDESDVECATRDQIYEEDVVKLEKVIKLVSKSLPAMEDLTKWKTYLKNTFIPVLDDCADGRISPRPSTKLQWKLMTKQSDKTDKVHQVFKKLIYKSIRLLSCQDESDNQWLRENILEELHSFKKNSDDLEGFRAIWRINDYVEANSRMMMATAEKEVNEMKFRIGIDNIKEFRKKFMERMEILEDDQNETPKSELRKINMLFQKLQGVDTGVINELQERFWTYNRDNSVGKVGKAFQLIESELPSLVNRTKSYRSKNSYGSRHKPIEVNRVKPYGRGNGGAKPIHNHRNGNAPREPLDRKKSKCFFCQEFGHYVVDCPLKAATIAAYTSQSSINK